VLRGVPQADRLGERPVVVLVPVPGGDLYGAGSEVGAGLFREEVAVPDEDGPLDHTRAVRRHPDLGHPSAEGVVQVAPDVAVGSGERDQAVVGVPLVLPDPAAAGQQPPGLTDQSALPVVLVADASGALEPGTGVEPVADGIRPGRIGARQVGCGQVAGAVVGIGLAPVRAGDCGDPAGRVQRPGCCDNPAVKVSHLARLHSASWRTHPLRQDSRQLPRRSPPARLDDLDQGPHQDHPMITTRYALGDALRCRTPRPGRG